MLRLLKSRDDADGWLVTYEPERPDAAADPAATAASEGDTGPGDVVSTGDAGGAEGDSGGDGGDGGAKPPTDQRSRWRRWRAVVVVVFLVSAALTLSPVSPFEQAQEHGRVPVPPGGNEPTPHSTVEPPSKPPQPIPTFPTPPPSSGPNPTLPPNRPPALPTVAEPAPIRGDGYELAFSDDFEGIAANASVWDSGRVANTPQPTADDGLITIRATQANDYAWGYAASTGPWVEGEPNYPNARAWEEGYFEARIRYSDNRWSWPSFWLMSMAKTEAWPGEDCSELNAEWDIFDNGIQHGDGSRPASDWYWTGLHRNTTDNTDDGYCGTGDEQRTHGQNLSHADPADWHTWAGHWTSDRMCTYMDGVELQCVEPYDTTSQPMRLTFSIQYLPQCEGCPPRPSSLEMQIDWVRVWQEP